jgi:precorrin-3B synthase
LRREQEGQAAVIRQSGAADRCPGVLALHAAADGHLARIRLPGGRVSALALDTVAGLAADFGNGIVELTSRASLQVRGLAPGDAAAAAERLRGAGLLPSPAHDRVRNIVAGPLAGRGPASLAATDELVAELDRRLCADPLLAELPGRFLFGVDDGAALIAVERCDVALVAAGDGAFRLWLAGRATTLVADARGHAAALALASGRVFRELRGDAWRIADLRDGAARIAHCLGGALLRCAPAHDVRPLALGALTQRDGLVAVTALAPLGRLDCATAARLAQLGELRLSSARTVTLLDVPAARAPRLLAELAALDLVVGEGSGWQGLTACAGLGACASAQFDVRAVAAARALERGPGSPAEHWAACERGCGCPPGALLGSRP